MLTPTEHAEQLYEQTTQSFVANLLRVMRVSDEDEFGSPTQLTKQALADRTGLSRGTLSGYVSSTVDGKRPANMDTRSICLIAHALNVPPAFLLMRPEDWSRLGQAIMFFSEAVQDEKFRALALDLIALRATGPAATSAAGLNLAEKLKICDAVPKVTEAKFQRQVNESTKRKKQGVLSTSALPPFGELKPSLIPSLLALCAIVGANLE